MNEFFSFLFTALGLYVFIVFIALSISVIIAEVIVRYRKWQIKKGMQLIDNGFERFGKVIK